MKNLCKFALVFAMFLGSFAYGQKTQREATKEDIVLVSPSSVAGKVVIDIHIVIGRTSRDCGGFGICKGTKLTIEILDKNSSNGAIVENNSDLSKSSKSKEMIVLEVGKAISKGIDTNLYVDEDVTFKTNDGGKTIPKGVYPLVTGNSKYGNYYVPLH